MMDFIKSCLFILLAWIPVYILGQTTEKNYVSQISAVCSGASYELGCGTGNGDKVMNVTKVILVMEAEAQAFACEDSQLCSLHLGGDDGDNVQEEAILNLVKSIHSNCQGKASCTGTLPAYQQVSATFPEGSYGGLCGWDSPEYLSQLSIVTKCVDADLVSTLPPYEYPPGGATTTKLSTTTTATTTTTTTTTAKPETTEKPVITTVGEKGVKSSRIGSLQQPAIAGIAIAFIALGVVAGVAALVGVAILIYILYNNSSSGPASKAPSITEYPLKGTTPNDSEFVEKQPIT
ncbi:hypothetical protein EB796_005023 [Bugula neritina]|uniref:Uncharacterized protein n=1 Tax=Bugula neritina TaxID=10212 RepID=A0A7J7KGA0_BUGNE|nr:hypothetical protein EB796_005023 [Bugula neritina]